MKIGQFTAASILLVFFGTGTASAQSIPAKTCLASGGTDRALCVGLIGAERAVVNDGKTVCDASGPNDLSDTYAVMNYIRSHPERQNEDLGSVADEVLKKLHPCS